MVQCTIDFGISFSRHVSNTDRVGKRYRNMANVFSIGDDDDGKIKFKAEILKDKTRNNFLIKKKYKIE